MQNCIIHVHDSIPYRGMMMILHKNNFMVLMVYMYIVVQKASFFYDLTIVQCANTFGKIVLVKINLI